MAGAFKTELFTDLNKMRPGEKLRILEVGAGLAAAGIEDASFDAVVMTLVLCSVRDQVKCFEEIKRVLRPGGSSSTWSTSSMTTPHSACSRNFSPRVASGHLLLTAAVWTGLLTKT